MDVHYTFMGKLFELCAFDQMIWSKFELFMDENLDIVMKKIGTTNQKNQKSELMHRIHTCQSFPIALTSIIVIIQEKDLLTFSITYWMATSQNVSPD